MLLGFMLLMSEALSIFLSLPLILRMPESMQPVFYLGEDQRVLCHLLARVPSRVEDVAQW